MNRIKAVLATACLSATSVLAEGSLVSAAAMEACGGVLIAGTDTGSAAQAGAAVDPATGGQAGAQVGAQVGALAAGMPADEALTLPQATMSSLGSTGGAPTAADSAGAGAADAPPADFSVLDQVTCAAGALPEGQSAITAKVQTLLDRAKVSPGVIDGWQGGMTESAIRAFEARRGLPVDGRMDGQVWQALLEVADAPVSQPYTITDADMQVAGPIPDDYAEKATYPRLEYERVAEGLAEKFHMDEEFLVALNPGSGFGTGDTITVMAPDAPIELRDKGADLSPAAEVVTIRVDKPSGRLYALDAAGVEVASYPVTIGSESTPSPSGTHEVLAVVQEPVYYYNPKNFVQGDNLKNLELPPGPNNPVGLVWIDLSEEGYGIHGTPEPAKLFTLASHGCVRMTNWDALELAAMVGKGAMVEFVQ